MISRKTKALSSAKGRICGAVLVFVAAFLCARPAPQKDGQSGSPLNPPQAGAVGISGASPADSALLPNAGLDRLTAALARQLDTRGLDLFSGRELEKLIADLTGAGVESAQSYAGRWAGRDPAGMAGWALQGRPKPDYVIWLLFNSWSRQDEKAALAAFEQLPARPPEERCRAMGALISGIGLRNPQAARKLAMTHLDLLANLSGSSRGSPFFEDFKGSGAFWNALSSLQDDPRRNKVLADYLNRPAVNEAEVNKRWTEASPVLRRNVVAGGFPAGNIPDGPAFSGLPAMMLEEAVKSGNRAMLIAGLRERISRNPGSLGESVDLAVEKLTGRDAMERPPYLIQAAAKKDFPKTLDYWRSLPEGLLKIRAAGALKAVAPAEFKSVMEAETAKFSPSDAMRAAEFE